MISTNINIGSDHTWDASAQLIIQNNSTVYGRSQIVIIVRSDYNEIGNINSGINDYWSVDGCRNGIIFKTKTHYNADAIPKFALQCVTSSYESYFGITCSGFNNGSLPVYNIDRDGHMTIFSTLNGISTAQLYYLTTITSDVQTQINNTNTTITNLSNSIGNLYNASCNPSFYNIFSRSIAYMVLIQFGNLNP